MLSFSHDRMLPWIERGIVDATAERERDLELLPGACVDRTGERCKRQSIRRHGGDRSPYIALERRLNISGAAEPPKLHLWWKSRTPGRRHLGTVIAASCSPITLWRSSGGAYCGRGHQIKALSGYAVDWHADGFLSAEEFIAFFELAENVGSHWWQIQW